MRIFLVAPSSANSKGDLFTDRMVDLVQVLGYQVVRKNIARTGREVDLIARHRHEDRIAIFECKAQADPLGGSAVNKFIGVLNAEALRSGGATGYLVSISGFKDSALEQESELPGARRCIMLDEVAIARELANGAVLGRPESAIAEASLLPERPSGSSADLDPDLVASNVGWCWIVYFVAGGERIAYTIVHASGQLLAERPRLELSAGLAPLGLTLPCIGPSATAHDQIRNDYFSYLETEYGHLSHEGLPADPSAAGVSLADIFVPMRVCPRAPEDKPASTNRPLQPPRQNTSIGEALAQSQRIALLGAPGAGKSTLLRRIALAYARGDKGFLTGENLDGEAVLPLLINCRDIELGRETPIELIADISRKAARPEQAESFTRFARDALEAGEAILMVDGLDEIQGEGSRVAFVRSLLQFMSVYPRARIVVTSREPGFRPIAGVIANYFTTFEINDLQPPEIRRLVLKWFALVPRRTERGKPPEEVAAEILSNDRLSRLSANPLLLTTLLLVERWVGDLPRRRAALYEKAIEVLLMTWNVEGHAPISLDEALPQLGFIAHQMTEAGEQRISQARLIRLLRDAKTAMPDVLGYASTGPTELLSSIEARSSLIIQSGHVLEDGTLQPAYEFKHLTFQEYLAAKAIVEKWMPECDLTVEAALADHLSDSIWTEVISLVAALCGRRASGLMRLLCDRFDEALATQDARDYTESHGDEKESERYALLIAACFADEVHVDPEIAYRAMPRIVTGLPQHDERRHFALILDSRYREVFIDVTRAECQTNNPANMPYIEAAAAHLFWSFRQLSQNEGLLALITRRLASEDMFDKCAAFGGLVQVYFRLNGGEAAYELEFGHNIDRNVRREAEALAPEYYESLRQLFLSDSSLSLIALGSAWALAWIARSVERTISLTDRQKFLDHAFPAILSGGDSIRHFASWLVVEYCSVPPGDLKLPPEVVAYAKALIRRTGIKKWPTYTERAAVLLWLLSEDTEQDELRASIETALQSDGSGRDLGFFESLTRYIPNLQLPEPDDPDLPGEDSA